MPNIDDYFGGQSLKASDFNDGPRAYVIKGFREHQFDGDDRAKVILQFHGSEQELVCNKTNLERIAVVLGSRDIAAWAGGQIVLQKEWTEFQGKPVEAVRVQMPQPAAAVPPAAPAQPAPPAAASAPPQPAAPAAPAAPAPPVPPVPDPQAQTGQYTPPPAPGSDDDIPF